MNTRPTTSARHTMVPPRQEDLWPAIGRTATESSRRPWSRLKDLPQTPASLRRTLEALASAREERVVSCLREVIEDLDFELLESHGEEVFASEHVPEPVKAHLRQRLELADVPSEALWDRLMAHGREVGMAYVGDFDLRISDRLVEALGRNPGDACERALALLRDDSIEDWRKIFCVQLVAATRYEPAVPALIEMLVLDADYLLERSVDALTRIGTPDVVARLEAFIPGKEWGVRLMARDPLERIKRPESEAALLRLFHTERAKDLRGFIGASLCMLCPGPHVLDELRDLLAAGRLEGWESGLQDGILAAGVMVGYEPPEAQQWRREWAKQNERMRKLLATDAPPAAASIPVTADLLHGPRKHKVGRNQPCPCGSGKKYKKCCVHTR